MQRPWRRAWCDAVCWSVLLAPAAAAQGAVQQSIVEESPARPGGSAIAWVQDAADAGSITGRVVTRATLETLKEAMAQLDDTAGRRIGRVFVDTAGAFRFGGLQPGPYLLRVSRIGYVAARATVVVDVGGSVRATALLAERTHY